MNKDSHYQTHLTTEECILYCQTGPSGKGDRMLKVCRYEDDYDKFRLGFQKEFELMAPLAKLCPTLPRYYRLITYHNAPGIEMELISGITLDEYLSQKKPVRFKEPAFLLSKDAITHICTQVYHTLSFLYQHGIVYFDLSPKNIIITNNNTFDIKFIDFTFCFHRSCQEIQNYKQYESRYRLETSGRPLAASLTRTMMFFQARLFYTSESSFAQLSRRDLANEHFFFREYFKMYFLHLFENENPDKDILNNDSSCTAPTVEGQLVLLSTYYKNFLSFLK